MSEKQNPSAKSRLDQLTRQEEKIIRLLREERNLVQKKFPLPYALLATFGFICTWAGLYQLIQQIDFLYRNPVVLLIFGLTILVLSGAAYRKLG